MEMEPRKFRTGILGHTGEKFHGIKIGVVLLVPEGEYFQVGESGKRLESQLTSWFRAESKMPNGWGAAEERRYIGVGNDVLVGHPDIQILEGWCIEI